MANAQGDRSAVMKGVVAGTPRLLRRLEDLAIIIAAVCAYAWLQAKLVVVRFVVPPAKPERSPYSTKRPVGCAFIPDDLVVPCHAGRRQA